MVNVPTGVWIDEEGRIVRPPETAYSQDFKLGNVEVQGAAYVAALRDWVKNGAESKYALTPAQLRRRFAPRNDDLRRADVHFRLGALFKQRDQTKLAKKHWAASQKLNPDSWNYHRQDWSYSPFDRSVKFGMKVAGLGDKPYYPKLDLEPPEPDEGTEERPKTGKKAPY